MQRNDIFCLILLCPGNSYSWNPQANYTDSFRYQWNTGNSRQRIQRVTKGEKQEKQERKYLDESIFLKDNKGDIFTFDKEPEMPEEKSIIEKIVDAIKKIIIK